MQISKMLFIDTYDVLRINSYSVYFLEQIEAKPFNIVDPKWLKKIYQKTKNLFSRFLNKLVLDIVGYKWLLMVKRAGGGGHVSLLAVLNVFRHTSLHLHPSRSLSLPYTCPSPYSSWPVPLHQVTCDPAAADQCPFTSWPVPLQQVTRDPGTASLDPAPADPWPCISWPLGTREGGRPLSCLHRQVICVLDGLWAPP